MKLAINTLIVLSIPGQLWLGGYHLCAIAAMTAIAAYEIFADGVWQRRVFG